MTEPSPPTSDAPPPSPPSPSAPSPAPISATAAVPPPRADAPPPSRVTPQSFGPAHGAAASAAKPPAPPPARPSRSAMPVLSAIGFLLLLAGLAWLWSEQQATDQRVTELAQAPPPSPPPPSADPARVAALETQVKELSARIATLQSKPPPDVAPLEARIAALEQKKPEPVPDTSGKLTEQLNAVAAEAAAAKTAEAAMTARLAELDARLKEAEQKQGTLAEHAAQAQRLAQAQAALEAGEPLGELAGAQPTLSRYAHTKPPTEAALRLAFPAAADAAEAASAPSTQGKSLGERMWLHASALVTVKQGDKVVVGAPAATVLASAHAKLEAGDLAGAVAALDGLDPAAAAAMSSWRGQAQSLLDARAALAEMARS